MATGETKKRKSGGQNDRYQKIEDLFSLNVNSILSPENLKGEVERSIGKSSSPAEYSDLLVGYMRWKMNEGDLPSSKDRFRRYVLPVLEANNEVYTASSIAMGLEGLNDLNFMDFKKQISGIHYVTFSKDLEIDFSGTYDGDSPKERPYFHEQLYSHAKYFDDPLLIVGETGTGKELVCKAIHTLSDRRLGPFREINCAAIPDNLLEDELFGHEKGAFTGADARRIGKFEECDKGIFFLDEIGKMSEHLQAKILKVIEDRKVSRLGSNDRIAIDIRFIAAAQPQNLDKALLPDLKYRLGYPDMIILPSLNERMDQTKDKGKTFISFSLMSVLKKMRRKEDEFTLSNATIRMLMAHDYEGNYRELENILRSAILKNLTARQQASLKNTSGPTQLKPEDFDWVKDFLRDATTEKQKVSPQLVPSDKPIELKDILSYAKGKAASIVEERFLDIFKNGQNIKSVFLKEGNPENAYQTFLKKVTNLTGKSVRELKKMVP